MVYTGFTGRQIWKTKCITVYYPLFTDAHSSCVSIEFLRFIRLRLALGVAESAQGILMVLLDLGSQSDQGIRCWKE